MDAIRQELEQGQLVRLNWFERDMATSVMMIWHAEKWCSPLMSAFMERVESRMTE